MLALAILCTGAAGSVIAKPDGVQVTPVIVDMPSERGMTSVRIHNWRAEDVAFETEILTWSQRDGEDQLSPSDEMIIAPSVFSIPAGGEQIVRLALKPGGRGGKTERAFRLLVRELPSDAPAENGLRVQLQMSLPVFAGPKDAAPILDVKSSSDGIMLMNYGTSRIRVISASADDEKLAVGLPRYLLPGSKAVWSRQMKTRSFNIEYLSRNASGPVSEKFAVYAPNASTGVR